MKYSLLPLKNKLLIIGIIIALCVGIFLLMKNGQSQEETILCTRLPRVKIKGRQPAAAPNYRLQWTNHFIIKVYFFDGSNSRKKAVIDVAKSWSNICGIKIEQTNSIDDSQIRITFRKGGYASAIGRECVQDKYTDKATMFLQGLDGNVSSEKFKRVVLHEFGHALGLEHELAHPNAKIPWDKQAVYDHYEKEGWSKSLVDQEIFQVLVPDSKEYPEFDSTSIMIYAIPASLTGGKYEISWPKALSKSDSVFIKQWYPL